MQEKTGNGHNVDLERFLEDIKTVVRDGQELLKVGMGVVRERAATGAQTTGRIVREKPYQSIGVVFGLGLLAGLVLAGALGGKGSEEEED